MLCMLPIPGGPPNQPKVIPENWKEQLKQQKKYIYKK